LDGLERFGGAPKGSPFSPLGTWQRAYKKTKECWAPGPNLVSRWEHESMHDGGCGHRTYVSIRGMAWEISCRAARGRRGSGARPTSTYQSTATMCSTSVGYIGNSMIVRWTSAATTVSSSSGTSTTGSSRHGVRYKDQRCWDSSLMA
jgi:hypothetical protein